MPVWLRRRQGASGKKIRNGDRRVGFPGCNHPDTPCRHPPYESLAAAAGFEFVEASEINANPKDQPSENEVVWRLPPTMAAPA